MARRAEKSVTTLCTRCVRDKSIDDGCVSKGPQTTPSDTCVCRNRCASTEVVHEDLADAVRPSQCVGRSCCHCRHIACRLHDPDNGDAFDSYSACRGLFGRTGSMPWCVPRLRVSSPRPRCEGNPPAGPFCVRSIGFVANPMIAIPWSCDTLCVPRQREWASRCHPKCRRPADSS